MVDIFKRKIKNYIYSATELLWARRWDDCCRDIEWVKKLPGIFPGGMAVGYNYLYVMTRILNEIEPDKILDVGLGISSTIFSFYMAEVKKNVGGYHYVIEQDEDWIDCYRQKNRLSETTYIEFLPTVIMEYRGKPYIGYKNFAEKMKQKKFEIISIDAPSGKLSSGQSTDERKLYYSRCDILN